MFYQEFILDRPAFRQQFCGGKMYLLPFKETELKNVLAELTAQGYSVKTSTSAIHSFPQSILIGAMPGSELARRLTELLARMISLSDLPYRKGKVYQ